MAINRKTITIFVAHPDDVVDEVEIIKDVCKVFDTSFRSSGFHIEALHYLDIPSKPGNPQKVINDILTNKCDIFIGIVKESIGNEGFREEVAIGLKRFSEDKIKFNFFVKKSDSMKEEARKEREAFLEPLKQQLLYSPYSTHEEFRNTVNRDLLESIVKITRKPLTKPIKQESESFSKKVVKQTQLDKKEEKKFTSTKEGTDIQKIAEKIQSSEIDKVELEEFEKARLFLYAAAQLYEEKIPSEILDNHENHLLYKLKDKVRPLFPEIKLIFRTLISDTYGVKTGWYWLKIKDGAKRLYYLANYHLRNDLSDDVREGALSLIDKTITIKDILILKGYENDSSENVKLKILEILGNHPCKNSLELVKDYLGSSEERVSKKAQATRFKILSVIDVHGALSELIKDEIPEVHGLPKYLRSKTYDSELRQLILHRNEWVRIEALDELTQRKSFTDDELNKLVVNENWSSRFLGLRELQNRGKEFTPDYIREVLKDDSKTKPFYLSHVYPFSTEDLVVKACKSMKLVEIKELLEWGHSGSVIYEYIASNFFKEFESEIKKDLEENFKSRQMELIQKDAKKTNLDPGTLTKILEKYQDFITKSFLKAAFNGILINGDKTYLKYVYKYIDDDDYTLRQLVVQIMEKFGSSEDGVLLVESAKRKKEYYDHKTILSAFKLDKLGKQKILLKHIEEESEEYTPLALAFCFKNGIKPGLEKLAKLLYSKINPVRIAAIEYLILTSDNKTLEKVLKEYVSKDTYFYNIVSRLDKVLYAPNIVRKLYLSELEDRWAQKSV